eukprot:TRINITY_DN3057_c0_g1_i1.p1 TRINITY_DN3057_c0_g1~~TRINITY_DN3057_c0_g1_i1.p1  ORF type:complete len:775 (-),score=171.91 TRINITY_DN3057_c0_g1_i1:82-2406(-)
MRSRAKKTKIVYTSPNPASFLSALRNHNGDAIADLLQSGLNVNLRFSFGQTALMISSGLGDEAIVRLLLQKGANPYLIDSVTGASALHKAAMSGNTVVAGLLLDIAPILLNFQATLTGHTPLHFAVWHKRAPMAEYLLSRGAYPSVKGQMTTTPLQSQGWPPNPSPMPSNMSIKSDIDQDIFARIETSFANRFAADSKYLDEHDLFHAIIANNVTRVRRALEEHPEDINARYPATGSSDSTMTPLLLAAYTNDEDMASHSDADDENDSQSSVIRLLLSVNPSLSVNDIFLQRNVLHWAAVYQHANIIKQICAKPVEAYIVNAASYQDGNTPLHEAVWFAYSSSSSSVQESIQVLDALLNSCHADANLVNYLLQTPLDIAKQRNYTELIDFLTQYTDHTEEKEGHWKKTRAIAGQSDVTTKLVRAVQQTDMPLLVQLLNDGVDVNVLDIDSGLSPLHWACAVGSEVMVDMLLSFGADVWLMDSKAGSFPLNWAVRSNNFRIVETLINHGAFLHSQVAVNGFSLLHDAVQHRSSHMIDYLLSVQQMNPSMIAQIDDVYAYQTESIFALYTQSLHENDKWEYNRIRTLFMNRFQQIQEWYANPQRVYNVLGKDNEVERLRALLHDPIARGTINDLTPLNNSGDSGYNLLLTATRDGHCELVSLLFDSANASLWSSFVNVRDVDYLMRSMAGHKAGYMGHAECAQVLVRTPGFEINAQGLFNGFSPLMDSTWHHNSAAALVYIQAGADKLLKNHMGETVEDMARMWGYTDIVDYLHRY